MYSFTDRPFGGNPAGVVPKVNNRSSVNMQNIAKELNLFETAFLTTSQNYQADFNIRYFTPSKEFDFCGHATWAAAWISATEYDWVKEEVIRFSTNIGIILLELTNDQIIMTQVARVKELVQT
jgi:PhzF family phenazine biosynthesis protein